MEPSFLCPHPAMREMVRFSLFSFLSMLLLYSIAAQQKEDPCNVTRLLPLFLSSCSRIHSSSSSQPPFLIFILHSHQLSFNLPTLTLIQGHHVNRFGQAPRTYCRWWPGWSHAGCSLRKGCRALSYFRTRHYCQAPR